jgi:hypothetical protein
MLYWLLTAVLPSGRVMYRPDRDREGLVDGRHECDDPWWILSHCLTQKGTHGWPGTGLAIVRQ